MKSRSVIGGSAFVAALAVVTGSVLLVGYVIAAASLLLMSAVLIRRVIRRSLTSRIRPSHQRWLDESDREAA